LILLSRCFGPTFALAEETPEALFQALDEVLAAFGDV